MTTELVEFNELKAQVETLVSPTLAITVTDLQSGSYAVEAGKQIKALSKALEAKRSELGAPLRAQLEQINAYAKQLKEPLDRAEAHIKNQIALFEIEQEKIRAAERAKADEEARQRAALLAQKQEEERQALIASQEAEARAAAMFGDDEEPETKVDVIAALEEKQIIEQVALKQQASDREFEIKQQGVKNVAKVWKCEAIDLAKVPREFLKVELNTAAVLAAARGGVTEIPGVKLWQEVSVRLGAKTYVPRSALGVR